MRELRALFMQLLLRFCVNTVQVIFGISPNNVLISTIKGTTLKFYQEIYFSLCSSIIFVILNKLFLFKSLIMADCL